MHTGFFSIALTCLKHAHDRPNWLQPGDPGVPWHHVGARPAHHPAPPGYPSCLTILGWCENGAHRCSAAACSRCACFFELLQATALQGSPVVCRPSLEVALPVAVALKCTFCLRIVRLLNGGGSATAKSGTCNQELRCNKTPFAKRTLPRRGAGHHRCGRGLQGRGSGGHGGRLPAQGWHGAQRRHVQERFYLQKPGGCSGEARCERSQGPQDCGAHAAFT